MAIPHVKPGKLITANHQNVVIDQVNQHTDDIAILQGSSGGDPGAIQEMIDTSVSTHVQTAEPHPAYDDMPSLTILFENGLA